MKENLRPNFKGDKSFKNNIKYFEFHHILPKSLFPLWAKRKSNLVALTAREHFFCHQLLTKIYPSFEMENALSIFCKNKKKERNLTSRQYEICRKAANKANLLRWSNPTYREKMKIIAVKAAEKRKQLYCEKPDLLDNMKKTASERSSKSHWWNNGTEERFCEICPDGWTKGRRKMTEQEKAQKANKCREHWINGDIDKDKVLQKRKRTYSNMTKEQLEKIHKNRSVSHKDFYMNLSEERRNELREHMNECRDKWLSSLTEEDKQKIYKKSAESYKRFYANLTEEEKRKLIEKQHTNIKNNIGTTGKTWCNNGKIQKLLDTIPEGWVKGMLKTKH